MNGNAMSLKARIRNLSKEKHIGPSYGNLERIAKIQIIQAHA